MTSTDIPKLLTAASYPFWDVLLILAVLLLIFQRTEPVLLPSLLLCGLGIVSQIIADTGYALTIPFGTYTTGTPYIDTFWFIGALLIGLAAPYQYATIARRIYQEHAQPARMCMALNIRLFCEMSIRKDAAAFGKVCSSMSHSYSIDAHPV